MTLSLYSTYKAWKRDRALETALVCPVRFPAAKRSSRFMHALAMLGLGLEGVSGGEDEHIHGIG